MTMTEQLRAADRRRRQAMIEADVSVLATLFADELTWTHSSGKKDDKPTFLEKIASGSTEYQTLEVSDDTIIQQGDVLIHHGNLAGRVRVDGREKSLNNRFLAVWKSSADGLQLLAWQSTAF